jgi:hypothetical protein
LEIWCTAKMRVRMAQTIGYSIRKKLQKANPMRKGKILRNDIFIGIFFI